MICKVSLILALVQAVLGACSRTVTRREIRDLNASERTSYYNAVKKLHAAPTDIFSSFSSRHYSNVGAAHGVPAFLPWHRQYLYLYELELQKIDANVVLPYWDWSRDSQAPERSIILSNTYLGGNGASSTSCVTNGVFANWQATVPNRHCLRRRYNGGSTIPAFYSAEALEAILSRSTTYDSFRTAIEGGPHGAVHVGIGGNGGDFSTMYSPNDPLFYLHHTFIDLLWSEWQARNPTKASTYNGGSVRSTDNMTPFNVQVQSTFKTTDLCYTYNRFGARLPSTITRRALGDFSFSTSKHRELFSFVNSFSTRRPFQRVSANDRTTRRKIRTPEPLPDSYIQANNLVISEVRETESLLANLTMALNSLTDFVPLAVIPDTL